MPKLYLKRSFQRLKNLLWHYPKSLFYNLYYGFPGKKLILIGVTGTDGKTTTTLLIHHCLLEAGIKAGSISTLGAQIGNQEIKIGLHTTSPDSSVVQKLFRRMVDAGITHVVVEVTAHAIDQYRYSGCRFKAAVITNVTHEHLDDFINFSLYTQTKAKLFRHTDFAILNHDDPSYQIIKDKTSASIVTYGINETSDFQAKDIRDSAKLLTFKVSNLTFKTDSNYHHQIYNILAAHAVLQTLHIDPQIILSVIKHFPEIKGRREEISNSYHFRTLIDFAHTPAALKTTLESLKKTTTGKLIVIFGATGGRDQTKRPIMGQVVSQIADVAVITADDTRNEKVENINRQIIAGIDQSRVKSKSFTYYDIGNRQDAFNMAVKLAASGDTIVACGKGHETTILHGKTEYPWSESAAFRTAFRLKTQHV
jgi:UDP-N-acetylmuramoyl-L-alanyl-D-glutamate--2,6-diaminopimelate ligase